MPRSQKGFAPLILLIIIALVVGAGTILTLTLLNRSATPAAPTAVETTSTKEVPPKTTDAATAVVELQTEYSNPLEKDAQYSNPFEDDTYENPFENLE